jgi:hypothetical protein
MPIQPTFASVFTSQKTVPVRTAALPRPFTNFVCDEAVRGYTLVAYFVGANVARSDVIGAPALEIRGVHALTWLLIAAASHIGMLLSVRERKGTLRLHSTSKISGA